MSIAGMDLYRRLLMSKICKPWGEVEDEFFGDFGEDRREILNF
jgi:hypothetical protein